MKVCCTYDLCRQQGRFSTSRVESGDGGPRASQCTTMCTKVFKSRKKIFLSFTHRIICIHVFLDQITKQPACSATVNESPVVRHRCVPRFSHSCNRNSAIAEVKTASGQIESNSDAAVAQTGRNYGARCRGSPRK